MLKIHVFNPKSIWHGQSDTENILYKRNHMEYPLFIECEASANMLLWVLEYLNASVSKTINASLGHTPLALFEMVVLNFFLIDMMESHMSTGLNNYWIH